MCPKPERQAGLGSDTAQDDERRWLRTTLSYSGAGGRSVRFEVHHSDSHTPSPIWTCIPEAAGDATEQIESIHHETPVLMKRLTN